MIDDTLRELRRLAPHSPVLAHFRSHEDLASKRGAGVQTPSAAAAVARADRELRHPRAFSHCGHVPSACDDDFCRATNRCEAEGGAP